jgi:predicted AlkP superfamily pyrophosphatase or phosphodiesterase
MTLASARRLVPAAQRTCRALILLGLLGSAGCALVGATKLVAQGDVRELRERPQVARAPSPDGAGILLLALDGVDRRLLYDMLHDGELPNLAALLGGNGGRFPHAHFDDTALSVLPSSTMVAWATALTGSPPAEHGIAGNEFFIRETRQLAAPVPVSIQDTSPVIACYTEDYVDRLRVAPSVWERMREHDPDVLVWVAMQHFHPGADRLLLTDRAVIAKAFEAFLEDEAEKHLGQKKSWAIYEKLDKQVIDVVDDHLADDPLPDVLSVYLSGTDSYAHVADEGPDQARRAYLRDVTDPLIGHLADRLAKRHALDDRWVVVTSDHGHSEVLHDDAHALSMEGDHEPPALLAKAGFRVRPFKLDVPPDADFQAVLAYQGAMAYVYVADRSACEQPGQPCDWTRPPRFAEDVLRVAEAFHRNNQDGRLVPALRGTLDLVLARRPRPLGSRTLPFEVYVGGGRLVPIGRYLREHPHPTYVELESRLRDLAVGSHGERAGDVILIAHNGDRTRPEDRYYFASRYRSWHGSPSRKDSEIPLIVAHPRLSSAAIAAAVRARRGAHIRQQDIADILIDLREPTSTAGSALVAQRRR